jgi:hypothetical protein
MTIDIKKIADIDKLLAFLRVGAKAKFNVSDTLVQELIDRVGVWVADKNIHVEFMSPNDARIAAFVGAGTACGIATALMLALRPSALIAAAVAGAAAGYAAAHVTIHVAPAGQHGMSTVTIA